MQLYLIRRVLEATEDGLTNIWQFRPHKLLSKHRYLHVASNVASNVASLFTLKQAWNVH